MTPTSFTFKVSVPNDADLASVIGEMARHAADYANVEAGAAAAFAERAKAMALKALGAGSATATTAVFAARDGRLSMTIGAESVSQSL